MTKATEKDNVETVAEEAPEAVKETAVVEPDYKSEAERLRAENETLRSQTTRTAAPVVTSSQLRGLSEDDWQKVEQTMGKTKDEILRQVEGEEIARRSNAPLQAKLNVAEALEDAADRDPQVNKLKSYMREYLSDVPVDEKADPERLKKHIEKAKVFAKGRLAEKGGYRTVVPTKDTKGKDISPDSGGDEDMEDDIKEGAEFNDGSFKVKVSALRGKAKDQEKEIKHPTQPHAVLLKNFDKPPMFKRG